VSLTFADKTSAAHEKRKPKGKRRPPPPPKRRLMSKQEIVAITGSTFPHIWALMRADKFPRAVAVGGKAMWRSEEIDAWLDNLKVRPLKGDAPLEETDA
jgi:predicted DNA-binding transcriptional regulator AlpA